MNDILQFEDDTLAISLDDTLRPGKTLLDDIVWKYRVKLTTINVKKDPPQEGKIRAALLEIDTSHQFQFVQEYVLGDRLSSGSFGTVYTTTHSPSREVYAVKVIDRANLSTKDTLAVFREASILRDCRDCMESIVGLIDFYESPAQFHMVQIYARGGGALVVRPNVHYYWLPNLPEGSLCASFNFSFFVFNHDETNVLSLFAW
jgi:serine/threonine protein kinase